MVFDDFATQLNPAVILSNRNLMTTGATAASLYMIVPVLRENLWWVAGLSVLSTVVKNTTAMAESRFGV